MGIDLVYVDETLPLLALVARVFYGGKIAMTIADFFVDVYLGNSKGVAVVRNLDRQQ